MCQDCVQAWKDMYVHLQKWPGWEDLQEEDNRAYKILFSYTGFPIVGPQQVREQLQYLCDHGPEATSNHIIDEIDKEMEKLRMTEIAVARQEFLKASILVVGDLKTKWNKLFGAITGPAGAAYRSLQDAETYLDETYKNLKQEMEDVALFSGELSDEVIKTLIRRTDRQIEERRSKRRMQVPESMLQGRHTNLTKEVLDRDTDNRMWLAYYSWRSKAESSWSSYTPARDQHASFLCGRSDGHDWAVRVPGTIKTVEKALDWITPGAVQKAIAAGKVTIRQGDMFFIQLRIFRHDFQALNGSDHKASHSWADGDTPIIVSHPQHGEVRLVGLKEGKAWRAVQQRQLGNFGERMGAD